MGSEDEEIRNELSREMDEMLIDDWIRDGARRPYETPEDSTDDRTRVRTLREVLADPDVLTPPEPLVPRLVWRGRVTLFAAREKTGKSTMAGAAAAAVSNGTQFLDGRCVRGTVLVVGLEEHIADLAQRLVRFAADEDRVLILDALDDIEDLGAHVIEHRPDLVVIDTLPALVERMRLDSGSATHWTPVMARIRRMAHATDCGILVAHHANRADGTYRDSSAIGAGVDVILEMREDADDPNVRRIRARGRIPVSDFSLRYVEDPRPPYFILEGGELSLDTRLLAFVDREPGCSTTRIRKGVSGRAEEIRNVLDQLADAGEVENRGPAQRSAWYRLSSDESPRGTWVEGVGNGSGTEVPAQGARAVPGEALPPKGGSPRNGPRERQMDFAAELHRSSHPPHSPAIRGSSTPASPHTASSEAAKPDNWSLCGLRKPAPDKAS